MLKITVTECNIKNKIKRNEDSITDIWDNIKHTNIRIIEVPEGGEREKGPEKIFEEIIAENFPNVGREIVNQVQEAKPKEEHIETHSNQTGKN